MVVSKLQGHTGGVKTAPAPLQVDMIKMFKTPACRRGNMARAEPPMPPLPTAHDNLPRQRDQALHPQRLCAPVSRSGDREPPKKQRPLSPHPAHSRRAGSRGGQLPDPSWCPPRPLPTAHRHQGATFVQPARDPRRPPRFHQNGRGAAARRARGAAQGSSLPGSWGSYPREICTR